MTCIFDIAANVTQKAARNTKRNSIQGFDRPAYKANKNLIKNISLFDVYIGNNIPKNKKSYGLNFKISDKSKTLSDNEIDHLMKNVTNNLIKEFGAELR